MESILVSACLLGVNCKYSGGNNLCPGVAALASRYRLVPVCPEQLGGLPTPREPAERRDDRVVTRSGKDVTAQFRRGAEETLRLAEATGCRRAILKARSPSCGVGPIYDGSFTGALVSGPGVTAALLAEQGIRAASEEDFSAPEGPDPGGTYRYLKLEIFIPETHFPQLQAALREADAGHIGNYDSCLSYSRVTGTWRPLSGTNPYIGAAGELSAEPELKVEVTIRASRLEDTVRAVKAVHPYEEPVINVLPLLAAGTDF